MSDWPAMQWGSDWERKLNMRCGKRLLKPPCAKTNPVKLLNASLSGDECGSLQDAKLSDYKIKTVKDLLQAQVPVCGCFED